MRCEIRGLGAPVRGRLRLRERLVCDDRARIVSRAALRARGEKRVFVRVLVVRHRGGRAQERLGADPGFRGPERMTPRTCDLARRSAGRSSRIDRVQRILRAIRRGERPCALEPVVGGHRRRRLRLAVLRRGVERRRMLDEEPLPIGVDRAGELRAHRHRAQRFQAKGEQSTDRQTCRRRTLERLGDRGSRARVIAVRLERARARPRGRSALSRRQRGGPLHRERIGPALGAEQRVDLEPREHVLDRLDRSNFAERLDQLQREVAFVLLTAADRDAHAPELHRRRGVFLRHGGEGVRRRLPALRGDERLPGHRRDRIARRRDRRRRGRGDRDARDGRRRRARRRSRGRGGRADPTPSPATSDRERRNGEREDDDDGPPHRALLRPRRSCDAWSDNGCGWASPRTRSASGAGSGCSADS